MSKSIFFLDTECYPNYFLIMLKDNEGNTHFFELSRQSKLDINHIKELISNNLTVGFNSKLYDMPMIEAALRGYNNASLKNISDSIIKQGAYGTLCKYNLWMSPEYDHIDIIQIPPGIKSSLKMYGARINTQFLQDLPYDPSVMLSYEQMRVVRDYCGNDIDITRDLYNQLQKPINLRIAISKKYNIDVRSRSDAQIAQDLILKKISRDTKVNNDIYDFYYKPPEYIKYKTEQLQNVLEQILAINFKGVKGDNILKSDIPSDIKINNSCYNIGIGGIHSTESNRAIVIKDDEFLIDVDVVSFYPTMILNNNYYPKGFSKQDFLQLFRQIYLDRMEAKRQDNIDDAATFKIILNGTFGKFGDQFSKLYAPEALIHTTLTGQLTQLMLIERLEEYGFNVVSSNTDGITVHFKKADYDLFCKIIKAWESKTNLKTEEVRYKALYNQSVNSYIAIKEDNSFKCKGLFASGDLSRNPAIKVCKDAIFNYLLTGKKIEDTIYNTPLTPENFLTVRKVASGGYWKKKYLGKIVRWYWSMGGEPIFTKEGDKVAGSDNAYPIMSLNKGLSFVYYEKYINKTYELLKTIGVNG